MDTSVSPHDMIVQTTETKQLVADSARDFAHQFIKPHVMDWDEAQYFPVRSNFLLKRLSARSIFSPSLIGIININYDLLPLMLAANISLICKLTTVYFKICLAITTF